MIWKKNHPMKWMAILTGLIGFHAPVFSQALMYSNAPETKPFYQNQNLEDEKNPEDFYGYKVDWTPVQFGVLSFYQLFHNESKVKGLDIGILST